MADLKSFKTTKFGIKEPPPIRKNSSQLLDLVLVPGLAFDPNCNRLGRGFGYFDRFIALEANYRERNVDQVSLKAIGLCFEEQVVDSVPMESWDMWMDALVSENQVFVK